MAQVIYDMLWIFFIIGLTYTSPVFIQIVETGYPGEERRGRGTPVHKQPFLHRNLERSTISSWCFQPGETERKEVKYE